MTFSTASCSKLCSSLLLLFLLINGNLARVTPKGAAKNIEATYDSLKKADDDHLCLNQSHDDLVHQDCHKEILPIDPSLNLFFHIHDLKVGKKIPLYFPIKNHSVISHMIPKEEADLIPFSLSNLNEILVFFKFSQDSYQAKAIKETLEHCELPPVKGESKFCATSLESLLGNVGRIVGSGNNLKVLTTTQLRNWTPHLQNYTILKVPKEIYGTKMVGCHPVPYPYAVFYCHWQQNDSRLFVLSLEGEKDGVRLEAVGICHMDTSQWDQRHASFRVLGIEPGTSPVCHVFPQDNLVWVSSASSVN